LADTRAVVRLGLNTRIVVAGQYGHVGCPLRLVLTVFRHLVVSKE
jgi:hypothetical protein